MQVGCPHQCRSVIELPPGSEDGLEPHGFGRAQQGVVDGGFGIEHGETDVEHPGDVVAVRGRRHGLQLGEPSFDLPARCTVYEAIQGGIAGEVFPDRGDPGQGRRRRRHGSDRSGFGGRPLGSGRGCLGSPWTRHPHDRDRDRHQGGDQKGEADSGDRSPRFTVGNGHRHRSLLDAGGENSTTYTTRNAANRPSAVGRSPTRRMALIG